MSSYNVVIKYYVHRRFILDEYGNIVPIGELADIFGVKAVIYVRSIVPMSPNPGEEFPGIVLIISKYEEEHPFVNGQELPIVSLIDGRFDTIGTFKVLSIYSGLSAAK